MKVAILSNAASIIITHNHPSGDVTPSPQDIEITHLMKQVCHIMQINLWDHIIYSGENYYSILQESLSLTTTFYQQMKMNRIVTGAIL